MKAYVYVTPKSTVLDPQGKTIQGALKKMGYSTVSDVRQGKYFVLTIGDTLAGENKKENRPEPNPRRDVAWHSAQQEVEKIAREVLTNPVIEEFSYSLEE